MSVFQDSMPAGVADVVCTFYIAAGQQAMHSKTFVEAAAWVEVAAGRRLQGAMHEGEVA
jgi:hypothetical protein